MQSKAKTVDGYLAEIPADRLAAIQAIREVILRNLDKDYEECMQYGMIAYSVPHRVYPAGYHCDPSLPLPFAGLASQKNYMSLYLMTNYGAGKEEEWFRAAWAKTGRKLDMGKCCIRFKRLEDVALDVVGEAIRRVPARKYIEVYESLLQGSAAQRASRSKGAKTKASTKATAKKPSATKKAAKKPATKRSARRR